MVRYPRGIIQPAAGGGVHFPLAMKSVRLARHGCTNRPFFHIVVIMKGRDQLDQPIEQLGTFDPMPNKYNEVLVSLNIERLRYWLSHRTTISKPVSILLGLSGFLPIHPLTYVRAWKGRAEALQFEAETLKENESVDSEENESVEVEENKSKDSDTTTETSS